jgi:hypothetical protein
VDYNLVLATMRDAGFASLYHNSGAFGLADASSARHVGWIGPPDASIRPAALALTRHVPPPFELNLAELAAAVWQEHLPGPAWVMPKSHWAYELDHGSREWMPDLLRSIGIDPAPLTPRNDAVAIEFAPAERGPFVQLVRALLANLLGSDFALAFPGRRAICTVHHHKQLWWTSDEQPVLATLDRLVPPQTTAPRPPSPGAPGDAGGTGDRPRAGGGEGPGPQ